MFCYQCEQRLQGSGCTARGVCGKEPEVAALQDYLVHACKGIAQYAHRARALGGIDRDVDHFVVKALFTTVTNVNFDAERVAEMIHQAARVRDRARRLYEETSRASGKGFPKLSGPAAFTPAAEREDLIAQGDAVGIQERQNRLGSDVTGLQELITYGLKGAAAYADHAQILGVADDDTYAGFHRLLDYLAGDPTGVDELTARALEAGELNLRVMELLDRANTETYGHPEPTVVRITPVKGKCILVSGHDLKDLGEVLKQTEGKGINVYTHGEMLSCLSYPGLKKYKHLVGNYGGAWQNQRQEFDLFPGPILMTTNCIQSPKATYKARIFTSGLVAWPGVRHIANRDFAPVIQAALEAPGFATNEAPKTITIGFAHRTVLSVADQLIDAVKAGKIRHLFLVGGCDGAKTGRNYYTEFAQQVPDDCLILTLACGKYRFNKLDFGDIGSIPRLLDMGQCNDAYSAVRVATALAEAFGCGVNDLPLSLILSWYEQKAVAILLTLLHLGIRGIRLGPTLPSFVTPKALAILADRFAIRPITTPEEDLRAILQAPVANPAHQA